MVNIKDFPDEVLVHIAYETLPDGIKAFSQCSKRFLLVSKNALIQHEAYKMKYRDIKMTKKEGAGPLLIEVVQNPRCAEYIRHADFEDCTEDVRVHLDEDISKILFQSLVQQPCISLTDFPGWVQQATLGHQDLIIAMLLLLLRRLETLIIPSTHYCELLVQGVTKWSQESMFPQPKLPLARLETVTVGNNEWDPAKPGQFFVDHGIKIFQGLPSLRSLSCSFRTTRAVDNPSIILQLHNGSTSLQIFDLELGAEELEIVLQHIRNVTEFTYIDRFFSGIVRNLNETLQKYAGDSLEELELQCVPTPSLQMANHGFTSLKGFTVLKKVTISLDSVRTMWNRSSYRPTLVEFLPASVEEMTVVGPTDTGLASLVLDELAEAKETHFPKLKSVHMSIENSSRTKVSSENAGIVLELDDEDDDEDDDDEDEEDEDEEEEDEEDEDEEEEDEEEEDEEGEDDDDEDDDAEGNEEILPMEESE